MMKKYISLSLVLVMSVSAAFASAAATPEFGRTQEEWDRLEDNTLEYAEIDDLINEYNPTVHNNEISLKDYKKEYGTTNDSARQAYADMAADLRSSIDYGDSGSMTYGMSAASALMSESSAENLEQLADSSLDDYETQQLGYEAAEKTLAMNAKSNMIAYYNNLLTAEKNGLSTELASAQLDVARTQAGAGTATEIDVLTATETLMNAQKELTASNAAANAALKKLQIMCGWKYSDAPVIGRLPDPDINRIAAIDLDADIRKAIENNYTLRINKKKLNNARYDSARETMEITIESNEADIGIAMTDLYDTLNSSKLVYEYAQMASDVQQQLLSIAEKKYELGEISEIELKTQQVAARTAGIAAEQARNSLLEAQMNYDYALAGLASA